MRSASHDGVVPFVAVDVEDYRRRIWPHLAGKTVRVGFQAEMMPRARENLELVEGPFVEAGHENFPDAGGSTVAHRVGAPVPRVEVADDAHALRVRRPDGEVNALRAGHLAHVRAQFLVLFIVRAFAGKIEIVVGEYRRKRIRIVGFELGGIREPELQAISGGRIGSPSRRFGVSGGKITSNMPPG